MFKRSNSVDLFTNKVMDFMTDDYVLVDKEETVKNSIEKLRTEKKSTIVVEEKEQVIGIITQKDILKRIAFTSNDSTKVSEVMTSPVKYVYEDDLLFHAVGKPFRRARHSLPRTHTHTHDATRCRTLTQPGCRPTLRRLGKQKI